MSLKKGWSPTAFGSCKTSFNPLNIKSKHRELFYLCPWKAKVSSGPHAHLCNVSLHHVLMGSQNHVDTFGQMKVKLMSGFTCSSCGHVDQAVEVVCSEHSGFDAMCKCLILEQDEDLRGAAKPLTQGCILREQSLQTWVKSAEMRNPDQWQTLHKSYYADRRQEIRCPNKLRENLYFPLLWKWIKMD